MIASEARISANRANALKSTGPKTEEGKGRSRENSYKHGLTGAGVVLGPGDAAEVERRLAGFQEVYRPATEAGQGLARRAAVLAVRLDRCAVREEAAIARDVRAAEDDFDEARHSEVDALFAMLVENPATAVRRLMRMPEGIDRLIGAWRDLLFDLTRGRGRFQVAQVEMTARLTGRKPGAIGRTRVEALVMALRLDFTCLGPEDGGGLEELARREWVRAELAELMQAEVRRLEAHRATLDLDRIAADRAGAADRALFDPSKPAELARKYEAAAERGMYRALREMKAIEAESAKSVPSAPARAPIPAPTPASLGSFSPPTPTRPSPTPPTPPTPAPAPIPAPIAAEGGSTFIPMAIGRPGPGRS